MKRARYITLLPEEERTLREAGLRGPKFELRMRCRCLLMSHQRHSINELIAYFQVSRQTVYAWMNSWHQWGLAGLYRKPGQGRKQTY